MKNVPTAKWPRTMMEKAQPVKTHQSLAFFRQSEQVDQLCLFLQLVEIQVGQLLLWDGQLCQGQRGQDQIEAGEGETHRGLQAGGVSAEKEWKTSS